MTKIKINPTEHAVLEVLEANSRRDGELCITFSWIADDAKLALKEVRRACRSLKKKGLAEFYRGLMTEDGEVAGSGYCVSKAGEAYLKPCDVCGDVITYDYAADNGAQILECEKHYKQSPKLTQTQTLL